MEEAVDALLLLPADAIWPCLDFPNVFEIKIGVSYFTSEKLFDAFFARCIPVYVGAELEPFGIPDSLYVRASPSQESVSEAISFALSMDYESWRSKVDAFLEDPQTREKWDGKSATRRILQLALGLEPNRA